MPLKVRTMTQLKQKIHVTSPRLHFSDLQVVFASFHFSLQIIDVCHFPLYILLEQQGHFHLSAEWPMNTVEAERAIH
jgi:hypothetical protein